MSKQTSKVAIMLNPFPAIRTVFGVVIEARLSSNEPHSAFIQRLESGRKLGLEFWEERCARYLSAVVDEGMAVERATTELLGSALKNHQGEFDFRLTDYFLEICVVNDLALRGCSGFEPLIARTGHKTPDYRFVIPDCQDRGRSALLEVKNLRAPIGINATFQRLIRELSVENPFLKSLGIFISHYWDNTVQFEEITNFLLSLDGIEPPDSRRLTLEGNVEIDVRLTARPGFIFVRRLPLGDSLGPFTEQDRLLHKANESIQKAISQLGQGPEAPDRTRFAPEDVARQPRTIARGHRGNPGDPFPRCLSSLKSQRGLAQGFPAQHICLSRIRKSK